MKKKSVLLVLIALSLALAGGCRNPIVLSDGLGEGSDARAVTLRETDAYGTIHEKGRLGPGALYELWKPAAAAWNNCLVVYAHGYTDPALPLALTDDIESMRGLLLANGYAIAHSSYSENGWAVKDGAIRIRQLSGYFGETYGEPGKVYLVGASEGSLISLMLAEKNPELFAGALCVGGPLGGARMEVKYIYNLRLLFDSFFRDELAVIAGLAGIPDVLVPPGLLPLKPLAPLALDLAEALGPSATDAHPTGSPFMSQGAPEFTQAVAPLLLALFQMSPPPLPEALLMATTTVNGLPMFNWSPSMLSSGAFVPELAITVAGGLWYNIHATEDLLGRTHEYMPIDTTQDVYYVPGFGPLAGVERLSSSVAAANYLERWYEPTGRLSIPVVILHTERDPIVPAAHAAAYAAMAAAAGSDAFLRTTVIPYFGHCQILTPPDYDADPVSFGAALIYDFNLMLVMSGNPPLATP